MFADGKQTIEQRTLFPGYVFFRTNAPEASGMITIPGIDYVLRLLSYKDEDCALRGQDTEFVDWLWDRGGILDVSHAYREGDCIRILDGPLKDLEGKIVQVNLKRKSVAVQLNGNNLMGRIWCSIEVVECVERPVYSWGSAAS